MKWYTVREKLPNDREKVIVWDGRHGCLGPENMHIASYYANDRLFRMLDNAYVVTDRPVLFLWHPLPELPLSWVGSVVACDMCLFEYTHTKSADSHVARCSYNPIEDGYILTPGGDTRFDAYDEPKWICRYHADKYLGKE